MKKMKKLFAVLLTLAMVLGMSMTSFAAGTGQTTSITVNNAKDATLKYDQIVAADQTNSTTGWKFTSDTYAQAFRTAFGAATNDDAILKLIALGKLELGPNANAKDGKINTAVDPENKVELGKQFSSALEQIKNTLPASSEVTADKDSYKLTETATAGLYLITASKTGHTYNPMVAYVAFDSNKTDGSVIAATVEAKGAEDQVKKEIVTVEGKDQGDSVMTGDVIPYKVTVSYPYYPANATNTKFVVKDTVENATLNKDTVIKVDGIVLANSEYEIVYTPADQPTEMTITFNYNSTLAGKEVTIEYKATVGDIKDGQKVKNTATSETDGKYTIAEVISDSAEFTLEKVDVNDHSKTLKGAQFTLYVKSDKGTETLEGIDGKFTVVETKTTDSNGKITFKGLDVDKTYYVVETKAPAGYSIDKTPRLLTGATKNTSTAPAVEGTDENEIPFTKVTTTTTVTNYTNNNLQITNTKLSALPSTGGIGTTIFTIAGCAIMIAAAGLFFASRKKSDNK